MTKQTTIVVIGSIRVKFLTQTMCTKKKNAYMQNHLFG